MANKRGEETEMGTKRPLNVIVSSLMFKKIYNKTVKGRHFLSADTLLKDIYIVGIAKPSAI